MHPDTLAVSRSIRDNHMDDEIHRETILQDMVIVTAATLTAMYYVKEASLFIDPGRKQLLLDYLGPAA